MEKIMNIEAVKKFMKAANQPPKNIQTAMLYHELTKEEYLEKADAFELVLKNMTTQNRCEHLDGIVDTMWCLIAESQAMGYDIEGAFEEVARSNMSKISDDGAIHKNSIGKVMKPETYFKPNLTKFV